MRSTDAIIQPRTIPTTAEFSAASILAGQRLAFHERSPARNLRASTGYNECLLARQDLTSLRDLATHKKLTQRQKSVAVPGSGTCVSNSSSIAEYSCCHRR